MTMDKIRVEEIYALEDQRFAAMSASDIDALQKLLADDLHYVHANGIVEDKPEFLRKIIDGERKYLKFNSLRREARQEGGFTFVFGEVDIEVERTAGLLKNQLVYTAVYRHASEPRFCAWQASPAVKP